VCFVLNGVRAGGLRRCGGNTSFCLRRNSGVKVEGFVKNRRVRWSVLKMMSDDSLVLTEENVELALDEARNTLGTLFGNSDQNREVGITGDVELVDLEGPTVILRLTGRFWHKRSDVLDRVANYLRSRIPEIFEVEIEDISQLDDADK